MLSQQRSRSERRRARGQGGGIADKDEGEAVDEEDSHRGGGQARRAQDALLVGWLQERRRNVVQLWANDTEREERGGATR